MIVHFVISCYRYILQQHRCQPERMACQARVKEMAHILLVFKGRLFGLSALLYFGALVFTAFAEVVGRHEQDYDATSSPHSRQGQSSGM